MMIKRADNLTRSQNFDLQSGIGRRESASCRVTSIDKQSRSDAEISSRQLIAPPIWDKDPYVRVRPGRYLVRVVEIQGPAWLRMGNRWSLRLDCALFEEPGNVSLFLNLGGTKNGYDAPGRQSNFYRYWTMANGEMPRKGQLLDWNIFIDKCFMAEVEDVAKNRLGGKKDESQIYSRIKEFIRLETL
jgi:hypothetical protein